MVAMMPVGKVKEIILDMLTETFDQVSGIYLDRGTTLFETLATITAEEASRPVSSRCASLAAQVEHTRFYLDVMEKYMSGNPPAEKVDWGEIWRTVEAVTPEQWEASKARLKASYTRVRTFIEGVDNGDGDELDGAMAVLVHSAYHLGEIRQALCTIKAGR